jgi:hypothetical protein
MNPSTIILVVLLLAVTIIIFWRVQRKGGNMILIGIGDKEAQVRFVERYKPFLSEYPELSKLLKKAFLRKLDNPPDKEIEAISGLPDDDSRVIDFDNKVFADRIVFYLGRITVDDFSELINLVSNAQGFGAYKILRGMYERIVTAVYISKYPSEAQPFLEAEDIQNWKIWKRALEVTPEIAAKYSPDQINELEEKYKKAKAKRNESVCNKCNQPTTNEAWTRVNLADMAQKADENLAILYGSCYLEPTLNTHATGSSLNRRIRPNNTDTGWTYRENSEEEARIALHLAHSLILRVLKLQESYFKLGLEAEIQTRIDAFEGVWVGIPPIK